MAEILKNVVLRFVWNEDYFQMIFMLLGIHSNSKCFVQIIFSKT